MIKGATHIGATVSVPIYGKIYRAHVLDMARMPDGTKIIVVVAPWAGHPHATEFSFRYIAE